MNRTKKTIEFPIEITSKNLERLEELAIEYDCTMSKAINEIIKIFYEANKKYNKEQELIKNES